MGEIVIFTKKSLMLVSAFSMTLLFGCSNGEAGKESKVGTETTEEIIEEIIEEKVPTPIEQVSKLSYEEAAVAIARMSANEFEDTGDDSPERIKLMRAYAKQYKVSEADSIQFAADLINEFAAGTYLININRDDVVLANIFKATIVENSDDVALVNFAKHYNDSMINLFIDAYAVDSEFVLQNEVEMNKALQLASNMQEIDK